MPLKSPTVDGLGYRSISAGIVAFRYAWAILLCLFATPVTAQFLDVRQSASPDAFTATAFHSLPIDAIPRSVAGQHIGSATIDPLMTASQEAAILAKLSRLDDSSWHGLTIERLVVELRSHVPVYLNLAELDVFGVDPGSPISGDDVPAGTLAARLAYLLEPLDLTMQIRRGILEITSRDAADGDPIIRIYDVETISENDGPPAWLGKSSQGYDFNSLQNNIQEHIDPDSWLSAGGTNAITMIHTMTRHYMVVSAPSTIQWKVTEFLDVLNRSELNRGQTPLRRSTIANHRNATQGPSNSLPRSRERLMRNKSSH